MIRGSQKKPNPDKLKQLRLKIKDLTRRVKALQVIHKDYSEIIEHATEIIFKVDATGVFYFVSTEFGRVLGYTAEEMTGKHFSSIVHPEELELCVKTFGELTIFGKAEDNIVFRVRHVDGHYRWVNCSAVCLFDENGTPTHCIGFAHDITQLQNVLDSLRGSEQALRISEERYRSLFDALREGILLFDSRGKIIACNPSAAVIFRTPREHIIGIDISESQNEKFVHDDGSYFPPHSHPLHVTLRTGESQEDVVMGLYRRDGSFFWISLNTQPIYYSDNKTTPDAVVCSFVDITQSREDKAELLKGQQMLHLENHVLEINAQPQSSLSSVTDYLLRSLEEISPDTYFSVLTKSEDGKRMMHLSAPSLPFECIAAIHGNVIGPHSGSCGAAMYLRQTVITENVYADPRWEKFIWLADKFQLGSCWSFPVLDAKSEVLATITVYHSQPKAPNTNDYNFFGKVINLLRIIIENKKAEAEVVKSNDRYIRATKAVAEAVLDAQEKERAEIGYELHDNVNQILSTARLYLELALNDEAQRINLITRSADSIANAVNEIRNISRSLVPSSISDLGLVLSIEDLIENIEITKKIKVEFYYQGDLEKTISEKRKLMIFRIIQEQVTNVLKHSDASRMVIELVFEKNSINLSISDNGKGFDPNKIKTKKGVGLHNIANRVELFNGKVSIVTSPGSGCKLNVFVPL